MKVHVIVQGHRENKRLFFSLSLYIYVQREKYQLKRNAIGNNQGNPLRAFAIWPAEKGQILMIPLIELVRAVDVTADVDYQREKNHVDRAWQKEEIWGGQGKRSILSVLSLS